MESIVDFFSSISPGARALILVGGLTFFWSIESILPLFHFQYRKWKHAGLNVFFTLTTIVVNFFFAFTIFGVASWCAERSFGVLYLFSAPLWVECFVGLLLLDLMGAYLVHFAEHKVKWMWRFHAIHHMDKQVDATTANRHHPVESLFRLAFTVLAVFLSGAPMWMVMLYQSLSVVASQFNHANISLPKNLDRIVSWVIVSPNMHKVHHHYKMPHTDSNYGNIFSLWDRLFGTWMHLDTPSITYGLDSVFDRNEANMKDQLSLPFRESMTTSSSV
jgi:sterol desaturase/sphingolipid hydroxylase (fatty acid hydroxylase superfamily)